MKKISNILVYGWFGEENIGDELILDSVTKLIKDKRPEIKVNVMGTKPKSVTKNHKGNSIISTYVDYRPVVILRTFKYGVINVLKNLFCNDIMIVTSGGALSDWHRNSTTSLFFMIDFFKFLKKDVYLLGVGAGPIDVNKSKKRFYKRLSYVKQITTRDHTSYKQLENLGLSNIECSKDLVYYMKDVLREEYNGGKKENSVGLVVASVCYETPAIHQEYKRQLECLIEGLVKKGYNVSLIPFHYSDDIGFIDSLKYDRNKVNVLYDEENMYQTIEYFNQQDLIIGLRYHSLVLGAILNKKVIPVVYHSKNGDFVDEFGVKNYAEYIGDGKNWDVSQLDYERILENVDKILKDEEYLKTVQKVLEEKERVNAEKDILDKILI